MPRETVVSRFLILNAAREDPGETQKHYSARSTSFKKCSGTCKASSEGMFLARDLKAQPGSKADTENEERLDVPCRRHHFEDEMRGEAAMLLR